MGHSIPRNEQPYDPNQHLRNCITTNGGAGNLHPSGKSTFSLQQLACLLGFPVWYQFVGGVTAVLRLIGNAVPPTFAQKLFSEIKKSLHESDKEMEAWSLEVLVVD